MIIFAVGLYSTPDAFAETYTVENAQGSSTPGCEPDCFIPSTITIDVGDTVTFANNDTAAHTSTSGSSTDGPSGVWDSSLVMMGTSFTTPALEAGEYPYFCMVHPWMEGLVIVGEGGTQITSEESSQAEEDAAAAIAAAEAAAEAEAAVAIAEAEAAARIAAAEAAAAIAEAEAAAAIEAAQAAIDAISSVNEEIKVSMDFANNSDESQPFAYILQIKNETGVTISISHVNGLLGSGQSLDQTLSFTPDETGIYTAEKFLWSNLDSPVPLTSEKEVFTFSVVS